MVASFFFGSKLKKNKPDFRFSTTAILNFGGFILNFWGLILNFGGLILNLGRFLVMPAVVFLIVLRPKWPDLKFYTKFWGSYTKFWGSYTKFVGVYTKNGGVCRAPLRPKP